MDPASQIDEVGDVVEALTALGFQPVLVGGMALVTLGSRRVTRDFDFVIAHPRARLADLAGVFYDRGFELASRLSAGGDVTATIDNHNVAVVRLRLDAPASAFFVKPRTGLRVDLMFDFPEPARGLAANATRTRIRSREFLIAAEGDLLRLKKIAHAKRAAPGDAEDIAFLQARRKSGR